MSNRPSSLRPPTDASVILTYRCPMRCQMCNIWQNPTNIADELKPEELECLPRLKFINLTGGEPFVRDDLEDVVRVCYRHAPRIVISTSGWFEDRVIALAKKFPEIGLRISIEGMQPTNDSLRGRQGGFERGLRTLQTLKQMGVKDIGFGCTVSDANSADMLKLYELSRRLGLEFATAAVHNSFYFHKSDNVIGEPERVARDLETLAGQQLSESHPKAWFRAYFNMGLANYVRGGRRLLPCQAGSINFFIDPYGEVYPCNGMESRHWMQSMGNIRKTPDFNELWHSEQAAQVRSLVANCPKNCWMIGTVSPMMHRYPLGPAAWVTRNKLRSMLGMPAKAIKSTINSN